MKLFLALSCQRAAKMSVENGHLVALSAALYRSVPTRVHELQKQVSKLKQENDWLMSAARAQAKKAQKELHWRMYSAAANLITDAHNQNAAHDCWREFNSALSDAAQAQSESERHEWQRKINEEAQKGFAKVSMRLTILPGCYQYKMKHNNIVWVKAVDADKACTKCFQIMRNGKVQRLGEWHYKRVLRGHDVTYKKLRRSKKSKPVCPHQPFSAFRSVR